MTEVGNRANGNSFKENIAAINNIEKDGIFAVLNPAAWVVASAQAERPNCDGGTIIKE